VTGRRQTLRGIDINVCRLPVTIYWKKMTTPTTYAEIDLKALRFNLRQLRKLSNTRQFSLPTRPKIKKQKVQHPVILAVIKGTRQANFDDPHDL